MSEAAVSSEVDPGSVPAYGSSWEHLRDELNRLTLLVRLRVMEQHKERPANPLDQFKGLVITETEIAELLTGMDARGEASASSRSYTAGREALKRSLDGLTAEIERRRLASLLEDVFLSLPNLSRVLGLNRFEEQCLLVCLASELDRRYEKLYSYLQDDVTRKKPTVDLVIQLICRDAGEKLGARIAFAAAAPLIKHRVLSLADAGEPLLSRSIKLEDRIVDYLLAVPGTDSRLDGAARLIEPGDEVDSLPVDESIGAKLCAFVRSLLYEGDDSCQDLLCCLRGPSGSGRRAMAQAICRELSLPLLVADLDKIRETAVPFRHAMQILCREAVLQPAAVCIENVDSIAEDSLLLDALIDAVSTYSRLTFLSCTRPIRFRRKLTRHTFIDQEFGVPSTSERRLLWKKAVSGRNCLATDADLALLASNFQFTAGQISDSVREARTLARWGKGPVAGIDATDLQKACRNQSTARLSSLAQKIEPRYGWQDIVLPIDQLGQLREICVQARHRDVVYGDWGFERRLSLGRGLNVLFSGPAGTGKTMAAEVIATELGLDLYKIDLSQVVSKYIGETEKNLHQVFQEAKSSYAILFFDEADALFGKRSEVKDAHDRYSNIEIGYLLQKMEEYDGIAILATNLRQNIDEAFGRRLQVIIDFPFPNEEYREMIWAVMFPPECPLGDDVDLAALARQIRVAGGNIKNIALSAAFFAAEEGGVIGMPHLVRASRREYQKLGRIWADSELGAAPGLVS